MKPMKPEEFAKVLCQKLEKVIRDRALAESQEETPLPVTVSNDCLFTSFFPIEVSVSFIYFLLFIYGYAEISSVGFRDSSLISLGHLA